MKHILLTLMLGMLLCSCQNQTEEVSSSVQSGGNAPAQLVFEKTEHDFGRVKQGETVGWYFQYKNEGNSELIINRAAAGCGCTVPDFDKKPLPPGETASLKVMYNSAGRSGYEEKTVTVHSNAENSVVTLKLIVEVVN